MKSNLLCISLMGVIAAVWHPAHALDQAGKSNDREVLSR